MDIDQTLSNYQISEPVIEYEQCSYCHRSFFKGKLSYHQKHCKEDRPMVHSPKKTPEQIHKNIIFDLNKDIFRSQEKKCKFCKMKLPSFLYSKHEQKCKLNMKVQSKMSDNQGQDVRKSSTEIDFKNKQQHLLPAIKSRRSPQKMKKVIIRETYEVKVRQQLRCLRKAQQIKQVQCPACNRIFSKEASQRHIPICQSLKLKQKLSIALKKRQKNGSHVLKTNHQRQRRFCKSVLQQKQQKVQQNNLQTLTPINPQSTSPQQYSIQ